MVNLQGNPGDDQLATNEATQPLQGPAHGNEATQHIQGPANGNEATQQVHGSRAIFGRIPMPVSSKNNVETWLIQLEAWFNLNAPITQRNKFDTVVASLPADWIRQISHVVRSPTIGIEYDVLKQALIDNYCDSEQQRIQKFISGIQLGDKKPSHLLNELRDVGRVTDESLLRSIWLQRLPPIIRAIAGAVQGSVNEQAAVADVSLEQLTITGSSIMEMTSTKTTPLSQPHHNAATVPSTVESTIIELTRRVDQLSINGYRHYNNRSRSRNRQSKDSQQEATSTKSNSKTCYYHRKFGTKARCCNPPCNFNGPANIFTSNKNIPHSASN